MNSPRHVIWITADHLRADNLGAYHSDFAHTPTIDRLAKNGVVFEQAYAQSPVCMPSRASFMTGCYPQQVSVVSNGQDLATDCPLTVARQFRAAGYQTAQIGKLHFQSHEDNDLDGRPRHDYGFDVFWCDEEPGCYDGPYQRWLASEGDEWLRRFRTNRPNAPQRLEEARHPVEIDAPARYSFSGWIAEQTRRYLHGWNGTRARHQRHFVHAGFYAPHPPLNPTSDMLDPLRDQAVPPPIRHDDEWADKPEPLASMLKHARMADSEIEAYRRHFAGMVTGIDMAVAEMVADLEQAGVLDDTLIVISSDHGDFCGDHGLVAKNHAWYDSVCHVPLIMHWPNGLGSGRRESGLVECTDILPTLLGLCGQPVPTAMSGIDWSTALTGASETPIDRDDVFAMHDHHNLMLRDQRWKYIRYQNGSDDNEVLYDLAADPHEFVNRAGEPELQGLLTSKRERCLQRVLQATAPLTPRTFRY